MLTQQHPKPLPLPHREVAGEQSIYQIGEPDNRDVARIGCELLVLLILLLLILLPVLRRTKLMDPGS